MDERGERVVCPVCGAEDHEYILISKVNGEILCCDRCIEDGYVKREWTV